MEKHIQKATLGRRFLAILIDAAMMVGLAILLYETMGRRWIMPKAGYYDVQKETIAMVEDSGLGVRNADGSGVSFLSYTSDEGKNEAGETVYAYQTYEDALFHYYTVYLPAASHDGYQIDDVVVDGKSVSPQEYYTVERFNEDILLLKISYDKDGSATISGNEYYTATPDADGKLTQRAVLKDSVKNLLSGEASEDRTKTLNALTKYYYDTHARTGLYSDAIVNSLEKQSYYQGLQKKANMASYYALLPSFIAPNLIFMLILPLCLKDGKTLGKWIMKLGLLSSDDLPASRLQALAHYSPAYVMTVLLCSPWYSMLIFFIEVIFLFVDFCVVLLSKKGESIGDKIAKTQVINLKTSTFYRTAEEAKAAEAEEAAKKKENARYEEEDQILDLSTINKRREEARKMDSFDEFEAKQTPHEEKPVLSSSPKVEEEAPSNGIDAPEAAEENASLPEAGEKGGGSKPE